MTRMITVLLFLLTSLAVAGLPPTQTRISGEAVDSTTFKFRFPNFTGTRAGTALQLDVNSIAGGGTGQTTAQAAINALSPLTTKGDILVHDGANNVRLPVAPGNGLFLVSDSSSTIGLGWSVVAGVSTVETLTDSHIFVGNSSNIATDVALSGDATIDDLGGLSLVPTGVVPGLYLNPDVVVDAKGRVTSIANGTSGGSSVLTDSHIFVGNAANLATDVAMSGDATIDNAGGLSLVPTGVVPGPYTNPSLTVDAKGRLTSVANGASSLTSTLTGSHIFVGSAANIATDVALSGDATLDNLGGMSLATTGVTPGSYTSANITVDSKGRITLAANGSGGGGGSTLNSATKTANYTITSNDDVILADTTNASFTITLPGASTVTIKPYRIKMIGSSTLNIGVQNVGNLIDEETSQSISTRNASVTLIPDGGVNWYVH